MKKLGIFSICLISCLLTACAGDKENKNEKKEPESVGRKERTAEMHTLLWKVSADVGIFQENVKLLNQELLDRGYDFQVAFEKTEAELGEDYEQEVKEELAEGTVDIINIGSESGGSCTGIDQTLREGYLASWDEYLQSERGKKLYEAYSEETWKTVELEGSIYSLPNENLIFGDSFAAFNMEYLSNEDIKKWDGTLEGLYQIVENVNLDSSIIPIYMGQNAEALMKEKGSYFYSGILFEPKERLVKNPYKDKKFLEILRTIQKGYDKGLFQKTFSLTNQSVYDEEEEKKVEQKKYAVYYGTGKGLEENFYYVKLPCMQVSSLSLSVGVRKDLEYKEDAFMLLDLLRTDDELANLLIWGEEGKDFTRKDNIAVRSDGKNVMMAKFMTGLCDGIYADEKTAYTDRRQFKQELQVAQENRKNPLLGFQIDTRGMEKALDKSYQVFQKYLDCFQKENFEQELDMAAKDWEKSNRKLQKNIQRQLEQK